MCDPMTIGSVIAQGAGVALQNRAANKASNLQALRMQQTRERNRALEDRQAAAIQNSTNAVNANVGRQGIEAAGNELSKILQAALKQRSAPMTASDRSAPQVFMDQAAVAQAATDMRAMQDAQNIAQLDAAGRYLSQTIAPQVADSFATGQLTGNFMRGNTNVLDTGMRSAATMANSPLAQVLQGAGRVGVGYGLYEDD